MRTLYRSVIGLVFMLLLAAPAPGLAATSGYACAPTPPDQLGPFYKRNAPLRDKVGSGYLLSGVVRSAANCAPIPWARVEIWLTGPNGRYGDAYRATVVSAMSGDYRFESDFPVVYEGRPPHIHIRVSAPGFAPLVTQHYPRPGETTGRFDLVLIPAP
jgi:protocatechuate 3,4-dioxygenase beta subunit